LGAHGALGADGLSARAAIGRAVLLVLTILADVVATLCCGAIRAVLRGLAPRGALPIAADGVVTICSTVDEANALLAFVANIVSADRLTGATSAAVAVAARAYPAAEQRSNRQRDQQPVPALSLLAIKRTRS
jgi:hypothetical protein